MLPASHVQASDFQAVSQLCVKATLEVTDIVEGMHSEIAGAAGLFGAPVRGVSGLVYRCIRGVTRLVGAGLDGCAEVLSPVLEGAAPARASLEREIALSVLNGVCGDYLRRSESSLAIPMQLRFAEPSRSSKGRLLVVVHGVCMTDRQWSWGGHNHAEALAGDCAYDPVYLRYNSGLHVSENGRLLADKLEALIESWPEPVHELSFLAFSMGGLVARSAWHYGAEAGHRWRSLVGKAAFLGTPHHGAPLERLGHGLEGLLAVSPFTSSLARLGTLRSAGITDLRYGALVDEDWASEDGALCFREPVVGRPLPEDIRCFAVAGLLTRSGAVGDGLVPLESALGQGEALVPESQRFVCHGASHLALLCRPDVSAFLKQAFGAGARHKG